jgi:hypothetical protein
LVERHYGFLDRAKFGIYQRELIEDALSNLRLEIDDLFSYSTNRFLREGKLKEDTISSEQRDRVSRLTKLSSLAKALYDKSRESRCDWALDLRLPETMVDEAALWNIVDNERLCFTIEEPSDALPERQPPLAAAVLLYPHQSTPNQSQESLRAIAIDDTLQDSRLTSLGVEETSWRLHSEHSTHEKSLSWRSRLQYLKCSDIAGEKHDVAIGATIWSILLWKTEWISGLCSCRINRITPKQYRDRPATPRYHVLRPRTRAHIGFNKYLLLGALHAETALEEPIAMYRGASGVRFRRQKDVEGIEIMELKRKDVRRELMRVGGLDVAEAVRYCFSHDEEEDENFRVTVDKLEKNVLHP